MNTENQFLDAKSFRYSLDWRFFLPISETSKILYIGEGGSEVQAFFARLNVNRFSVLDGDNLDKIRSSPDLPSTFDVIAIPYDIPSHGEYAALKKRLSPGGSLLIGFSNRYLSIRKNAISLLKLRFLLARAGFSKVKYYGIFPDQYAPEYIFPLNLHAVAFALRHRYQYRMKSWLLQGLLFSPFLFLLLYCAPAYYAIATSDNP